MPEKEQLVRIPLGRNHAGEPIDELYKMNYSGCETKLPKNGDFYALQ